MPMDNKALQNRENPETADVTLAQMLSFREEKEAAQEVLKNRFPGSVVVSLGMNIPGPQKNNNTIMAAFREGTEMLDSLFLQQGIQVFWKNVTSKPEGNVALYALGGVDAMKLKQRTAVQEETHPLGRLFDIDVHTQGGAVSRRVLGFPERKCLLCGNDAKACGRSRAHSLEELTKKVYDIIDCWKHARPDECDQKRPEDRKEFGVMPKQWEDCGIAQRAKYALLEEVYTQPKPGLVDPFSNGAHTDMCLATFEQSAQALEPYFQEMAELGFRMPEDPQGLFREIRNVGTRAEAAMYRATAGVNTHKGAIFSLGILCAAAGACIRTYGKITLSRLLQTEQAMVRDLLAEEIQTLRAREPQSNGEKNLKKYGVTGIRGEAMNGFASVREIALPVLCEGLRTGKEWNLVKLQTLLSLMSRVDDSNVLFRCGLTGMWEVQRIAQEFLSNGGAYAPDAVERLQELDACFTNKNYSNGSCADLLAIAIFLQDLACTKGREGEA